MRTVITSIIEVLNHRYVSTKLQQYKCSENHPFCPRVELYVLPSEAISWTKISISKHREFFLSLFEIIISKNNIDFIVCLQNSKKRFYFND